MNISDFLVHSYEKIVHSNGLLERLRFNSLIRFSIRIISNVVIPIYYRITMDDINNRLSFRDDLNNPRIIVSLTSFPARINRLWLVIESLLRQTHKPYKIILYLSINQFKSIDELPLSLKKQTKRGLDIQFVNGDIKSHKKYYYAISSFPNDCIVTVDDDVFYSSSLINDLINIHNNYPDCIIANTARVISKTNSELEDYALWEYAKSGTLSNDNFLVGIGGVLYPPNCLFDLWNRDDLFMKLCPKADDVWLNAMARLKGTFIMKSFSSTSTLPVINHNPQNLHSTNVSQNQNNVQLIKVENYLKDQLGMTNFKW